eukprot:scaffold93339_cov36-Attheya_sp.AAC.1
MVFRNSSAALAFMRSGCVGRAACEKAPQTLVEATMNIDLPWVQFVPGTATVAYGRSRTCKPTVLEYQAMIVYETLSGFFCATRD